MSMKSEIETAGWRLIRAVDTAKSPRLRILGSARGPDLAVVVAFVAIGLLLSVLFPLSAETVIQLGQMF
jgi:hypothetical protein